MTLVPKHPFRSLEFQRLSHERYHIRLRNCLIRPNGQRMIFIRLVPQFAFKEQVAWHLSHRPKHARVIYPSAYELLLYHSLTCLAVSNHHV